MFERLEKKLKTKRQELHSLRLSLRSTNIKARYYALMKFEPLKIEVAELEQLLEKKLTAFINRMTIQGSRANLVNT